MAKYLVEYTDDRIEKIAEQEGLGRQMLHDDFTETGGVITFIDPLPPTPKQLQAEADEARLREIASMSNSAIPLPVLTEGFVLLCNKLIYK